MAIDWNAFTPWTSLIGGLLIGLASALFMLGSGRVAGIAGIVAGPLRALTSAASLRPHRTRLLFIGGLLISPWLWILFSPLPAIRIDVGWASLAVAGLLVGVGVRMGNGCTSGHGVCGLSRLSARSLVNVMVFMDAGIATVYVMRHLT